MRSVQAAVPVSPSPRPRCPELVSRLTPPETSRAEAMPPLIPLRLSGR